MFSDEQGLKEANGSKNRGLVVRSQLSCDEELKTYHLYVFVEIDLFFLLQFLKKKQLEISSITS